MTTRYTAMACVLLALAVAARGRFSYRTCTCQLEPSLYTRGRMFGTACYVRGHGYCNRFFVQQAPIAAPVRRFRGGGGGPRFNIGGRFGGNGIEEDLSSGSTRFLGARYAAMEAARRAADAQRRLDLSGRFGGVPTVRPGSPAAALAQEKRADDRSLALGYKALEQIYFLQNLLAGGRR